MKTFVTSLVAALALAGAASAATPYVQGSVGTSFQAGDTSWTNVDSALSVGEALGPVRVEGEFVHLRNLDSRSVTGNLANANALYDFAKIGPVKPFLGVGVGYGFASGSNVSSTGGAVWNAQGGVSLDLTKHVAAVVSYRYFDSNDIETILHSNASTIKRTSDQVALFGLRYSF
jgi:opacity protein-like surface antigen